MDEYRTNKVVIITVVSQVHPKDFIQQVLISTQHMTVKFNVSYSKKYAVDLNALYHL
jgi:hypothetical protein